MNITVDVWWYALLQFFKPIRIVWRETWIPKFPLKLNLQWQSLAKPMVSCRSVHFSRQAAHSLEFYTRIWCWPCDSWPAFKCSICRRFVLWSWMGGARSWLDLKVLFSCTSAWALGTYQAHGALTGMSLQSLARNGVDIALARYLFSLSKVNCR